MTPRKVLVLGSSGMLGRSVCKQLRGVDVMLVESSRSNGQRFEVQVDSVQELLEKSGLKELDYVVNCIGVTKLHIDDSDSRSVERAVRINSLFPFNLARAAEEQGIRVIQVATDCVFSGEDGGYIESSSHDAKDVYGKTKSLGEVSSLSAMHLRCSLIGPEAPGRSTLFFEWVRNLSPGARVSGYVNHYWNGLTSTAFARIVSGIVMEGYFRPGVQHLVPSDSVTKSELMKLILEHLNYGQAVRIDQVETQPAVDRTLSTSSPRQNQELFELGGFRTNPSIREMIEGLPWTELGRKNLV